MRLSKKHLFLLLIPAALALLAAGGGTARAEVNVNINLGPPPIVVAEPPAVVMVPQSNVYFVPDPHLEVFFYGGYWWSPRGPAWYRARAYNGPWAVVERSRVPRAVIYVPRDYRARYERERHIPYGQWKKGHGAWERDNRKAHRNWEKQRAREMKARDRHDRREDRREDRRDDRGRNGGGDRR
jgi:hypothetical protein